MFTTEEEVELHTRFQRAFLVALNRIAQGVTSGSESSSQEQVREKD